MSKKIWILNHYARTPDMVGGTRHYDLAKELIKKNYNVIIFASGFEHKLRKYMKIDKEKLTKTEKYNGICFVWINTFPYYYNNWRRILNIISYTIRILSISRKFEKPDVIIGSSPHPFAAFAAWWLSRKYKAKFIFEVRDLWPQTIIDMGIIKGNSIIAKLFYCLENFMYKRAEKIIILLPNADEYIKSKGIPNDKIVWISNGVNLEQFDNPENFGHSSEVNIFFNKYKDKFKVVYTGALGPVNGLEIVIDAANLFYKRYKNIHFFLIGEGIEKKKLIKRTNQYGIDNITFLKPIPKLQIPKILHQSDLLLICFKRLDVFKNGISPNKLYDYLASGKPIIMSVETSNNIVRDANAGLVVEPGNPEALVKGIVKIKNMTAMERERLGANGRAHVEKYYNIKKLADKLEKIL